MLGTCQCTAKHGRGYHRYTGKCFQAAVRLVDVRVPAKGGTADLAAMFAGQFDPEVVERIPMCSACARHADGGK